MSSKDLLFNSYCKGYFKEFYAFKNFLFPPMHPVPGSKGGWETQGVIFTFKTYPSHSRLKKCHQRRDQDNLCEVELLIHPYSKITLFIPPN